MADTIKHTSSSNSQNKPANSTAAPSIDIKNPDVVQQGLMGGWHWIENNVKLIFALFVVGILVALGFVGFQFVEKRQERAAQDSYYAAEAKYVKLRDAFDRAKFQAFMPAGSETPSADKPATGDLEQDYGPVLNELEKVARDHAGTAGGAQAALLAAETYLTYKQSEKAAELAQIPAKNMPDSQILSQLAKVLWGNAVAAKGDCQAALGIWKDVLSNKSAQFLHADVGLRSGLCFETLNQPEQAIEMYKKVTAEGGESAASSTAKGLLRALEVKSKSQPASQG